MKAKELKVLEKLYLMPTYQRFDLVLSQGEGCEVQDSEGNHYLDLTSGIGVNSLGWADTEWVQAIHEQASTLQHTSNLFYSEPGILLARDLCERTGMRKVFFANSGAEANEAAIKIARKYALSRGYQGRSTIVTLTNSFHGRTLATLKATGQVDFHHSFGPFPEGFQYLDPEAPMAEIEATLDDSVCAVMIEVIQGEGGVIPLSERFLSDVQTICSTKDILLVIDEVQTGVGRTGTFFAYEAFDLSPDIVTLAKGLGGGLPIGATLVGQKCEQVLTYGDHGSTFGMNPVSMAGARVVLSRLTPTFLSEVKRKGDYLMAAIATMPHVMAVSGRGLMIGVQYDETVSLDALHQQLMREGLLTLKAHGRLRLLPPLTMTDDEIDAAIARMQHTLEGWK